MDFFRRVPPIIVVLLAITKGGLFIQNLAPEADHGPSQMPLTYRERTNALPDLHQAACLVDQKAAVIAHRRK